jgi:hypothetical protein
VLGQPVDRVPYWLFWSPWGRAWQRWEKEGKPAEVTDFRTFMKPDCVPLVIPVDFGPCPAVGPELISEDADYMVYRDRWGIVRRDYKHGESMSAFLEFPVSSRDDWEKYKAERLDPSNPQRLAADWLGAGQAWNEQGLPVQLGAFPDFSIYGALRWLLGDEECLVAFYEDPELVHDIMEHLTDLFVTVGREVVKAVRVDVMHVWEDMCGRQGPLISPKHWREFMGPCYRRLKELCEEGGIEVMSVDTDGNPDDIVPPMMEAGVNYLYPNEVAAGVDVNEYRERYPDLALMGGIDKRELAKDPEAIDAELDRVWPAVLKGRYIPDLDHLVPDDVSWGNYVHYAEGLRARVMGEA